MGSSFISAAERQRIAREQATTVDEDERRDAYRRIAIQWLEKSKDHIIPPRQSDVYDQTSAGWYGEKHWPRPRDTILPPYSAGDTYVTKEIMALTQEQDYVVIITNRTAENGDPIIFTDANIVTQKATSLKDAAEKRVKRLGVPSTTSYVVQPGSRIFVAGPKVLTYLRNTSGGPENAAEFATFDLDYESNPHWTVK